MTNRSLLRVALYELYSINTFKIFTIINSIMKVNKQEALELQNPFMSAILVLLSDIEMTYKNNKLFFFLVDLI